MLWLKNFKMISRRKLVLLRVARKEIQQKLSQTGNSQNFDLAIFRGLSGSVSISFRRSKIFLAEANRKQFCVGGKLVSGNSVTMKMIHKKVAIIGGLRSA